MKMLLLLAICVYASANGFFLEENAAQAYRAQDYNKARELYQAQVEQDPENAQALYNLGKTAYKLADFENAQKCFEKATHNTAACPQLQEQAAFELGDSCFQTDKLDGALRAYNRVLAINKDNEHARKRIEMVKKRQEEKKQQEQQQDQQDKDGQNQDPKNGSEDKEKKSDRDQQQKDKDKKSQKDNSGDQQKNKSQTGDQQNKSQQGDTKKPDKRDHEQTEKTGKQSEQNKKAEHDKRTDHDKNGSGKDSQQQDAQKQDKAEHEKTPQDKQDSADKRKQDGQKQQVGQSRAAKKKNTPDLNQQEQTVLQLIEQADTQAYRQLINQEVKQAADNYDESHSW